MRKTNAKANKLTDNNEDNNDVSANPSFSRHIEVRTLLSEIKLLLSNMASVRV